MCLSKMNSLFESFDSGGVMNWLVPMVSLMLVILPSYWLVGGSLGQMLKKSFALVHADLEVMFVKGGGYVFIGLFLCIFSMNFLGLFPYIFTSSSHICVTLGLGLPLWLGGQMLCWTKSTNISFAHLVPEGSPSVLAPLLVLVELISNLIRPLTLGLRLMGNMVAGHLMLVLLGGGASVDLPVMVLGVMFGLMLMILLELGVSVIQSYVFMLLSSIYAVEAIH